MGNGKQHTQGPWTLQDGSRDGGKTITITSTDSLGDWALASVNLCMGKESEANARLIVSAPEMFEALKSAVKTAGGMYLMPAPQYEAAIAKAEGAQ